MITYRASRWLVCVLAISFTSACIGPQLVPCGDKLCPAGDTCMNDRCASSDQIAACVGVVEGGTCTLGGGVGRCEGGVCVAAGCGNGVIDPGEVCDDGNTVSGDGCRGDCGRLEACGDGVVDVGEPCDDGNTNPADGCDACVATAWRATALIGGNRDATKVGISYPAAVALDRFGNLYIADSHDSRIRRVDATGVITTFAGTGTAGYSGDGGAATSARLYIPYGVAVDGLGNVYIANLGNNRIRRVGVTGVITTVAGTGTAGWSGDGAAATSAQLSAPQSVAIDGLGNLYIADTGNHRARRVDGSGIITTLAGTGTSGYGGDGAAATSAQLASPSGIAVGDLGSVYIADAGNNRIRRVATSGVITTVAGTGTAGALGDGGAATSAQLSQPQSVAIDGLGNVYVADSGSYRVRRVDTAGIIATVAGNGIFGDGGDGGAATSAEFGYPTGVALDGLGDLYISDGQDGRVRRVDPTGMIETAAGTGSTGYQGDGGAATSATFWGPIGLAVDGLGHVLIGDTFHSRIRRVDAAGLITTIAGTGITGYDGDGGPATSALLVYPQGIAFDALGDLYMADPQINVIRRVDTTGIITTVAGSLAYGYSGDNGPATSARLASPQSVAVDGLGNLYIADSDNNRIRRVDPAGVITTVAGTGAHGYSGDSGAATSAQLAGPQSVAVDGLGNLYISDADNNRIRRVTAGVITTVAGTGTVGGSGDGGAATLARLAVPQGIAVDGQGNLYIADRDNNRIRRVDPIGVITTIAGTGIPGRSGDGGAATLATLEAPYGVVADGFGGIDIADTNNDLVRHVDPAGVITTLAGGVDPEGMGPLGQAHLADPTAVVIAPSFTLMAGGSSGTVEVAFAASAWLEVVAGRYPQPSVIGARARFRGAGFGDVGGVAYDAAANAIYITESTSNRLQVVTIVDPADATTWTIAPLANTAGTAGFADGAATTARFRRPSGLYLDPIAHQLYVADTGNHVVRAIDLTGGVANATVRTVAGVNATRGFFGDGGAATSALLFEPRAITQCANGDFFIADTGNERVRRIAAATGVISTVLGVGVAASSGDGLPASAFPVNAPLGLACDAIGNLFVTSTTTVRMLPADANGIVDGSGGVQTIYGAPPRTSFPASVTTCLTGLAVADATSVQVVDSCTGLLVELRRAPM